MEISDFIIELKKKIVKAGSARKLAKELGISPAYLSDIILGRREPGDKILQPLGLCKKVIIIRNVTFIKED